MTNFPRRTPAERLTRNVHARRALREKSADDEFVSGAIRHVILWGLTIITFVTMIVVTIVVLAGGLPFEYLWAWGVPFALGLAAMINVAVTIKRSMEKF